MPLALLAAVSLGGCGSRAARVAPPPLNPAEVAAAAIAQWDANRDGRLSADEIKSVPALKVQGPLLDGNGDGAVTAEELAARLQAYKDTRLAVMACPCRVLLDSQPLAGAEVVLDPEACFNRKETARGVTNAFGDVSPGVDAPDLPKHLRGARLGWYRVRITHSQKNIPARYNDNSELGVEVSSDALTGVNVFKLSSRY